MKCRVCGWALEEEWTGVTWICPECIALAEQGNDAFVIRDYLGHRSVSTTNIYVASSSARFDRVWRRGHQAPVAQRQSAPLIRV